MRWARLTVLLALPVAALGVGLLRQFPTRESCRASGRLLEPTGRHCVAADGYVQLREHVLFHVSEVLVLLGIVLVLAAIAYWFVRRRSRPAV